MTNRTEELHPGKLDCGLDTLATHYTMPVSEGV
jgi:hypothetical protein